MSRPFARHARLAGVLLAAIALSACGVDRADSDVAAAPAATASAAGPVVLLAKQALTVLDQPVVYPAGASAEVSSSIVTLAPGAETGWHRHDAPMYAYILEGAVTVSYEGGVVKTYSAGEAIMEAIGTFHNGRNAGAVPVRILVVNIGAEGVENSVKRP